MLPLLLVSCLNLHYLSTQTPEWRSGPTIFVYVYLFVVAVVVAVSGGAWREYAFVHELNKPGPNEPKSSEQSGSRSSIRIFLVGGLSLCGLSALLASGFSTLAFLGVEWLISAMKGHEHLLAVFGPPLLLSVPFLTLVFGAGLVGRDFQDWMREWLARVRAWSLMLGLLWIVAFGIVLFGPSLVELLSKSGRLIATIKWSAVAAWVATTAVSLRAGKSGKTSGDKDDTQTKSSLDWLALVGPYVYIVGLLVLLSWAVLKLVTWKLVNLNGSERWDSIILVFVASMVLFVIFGFRVDINEFSLNKFYCNRLTRCYLGASNSRRQPSPLTGFDDRDTRGMQISRLLPKTPPVMEGTKPEEEKDFVPYAGPFPIICTTLNLTFGEDLAWQERKAASFAFTPLYSGYNVGWTSGKGREKLCFNGFVPTYNYGFADGGINISTAVAISGAAASPNGGYHTNPGIAFLMTMFDVRLGWWILNPRRLTHLAGASPLVTGHPKTDQASPRFAPIQLAKELLGMTDDRSKYVYLSDGGHFDNMGLYELVRRRCYRILICDGEEDQKYVFDGLATAIRKCRIDFGVEIVLSDLKKLRLDPNTKYSHAHFATGTIRYPEAGGSSSSKTGTILYLKSSLTGTRSFTLPDGYKKQLGTEPADILNYKLQHGTFPHDTTLNQWFTESQFESYRRLGCHVVEEIQSCGWWESFKPEPIKPEPVKPGLVAGCGC